MEAVAAIAAYWQREIKEIDIHNEKQLKKNVTK